MGRYSLDNYEYDKHLSEKKKTQELRERRDARKNANKGYEGFHFGIDSKPVYTRDKDEFKRELSKRGLMMRDDVRGGLTKGKR
jgi:hypothetical protein